MHHRLAPYIENAAESTAACLLTMVKGNIFLLNAGHWLTASQTGVIAGVITATTILAAHVQKSWTTSILLGVVTTFVDYFVHSGEFVPMVLDALVTGAGATALSLMVGWLIRWRHHLKRVVRS